MVDKFGESLTRGLLISWVQSCLVDNGNIEFGPGHIIFSDFNFDQVDWCIKENKKAIIQRLDGFVEHKTQSLVDLAKSYECLLLLRGFLDDQDV
jgi:hypothetical protein